MGSWLASLPQTSLGWLAFVRIGLGLALVSQALSKLGVNVGGQPGPNWLVNSAPLKGILEGAVKGPTIDPLYRSFLEGVVLPNVGTFSVLVTLGELLAGLALVVGLGTRLAAWVAFFLSLNFQLMKGIPAGGSYTDKLFMLLELVVAFTAAGYVLGLDGILRASLPAWLHPLLSKTPAEEEVGVPARRRSVQPA
jgi:uncharacterized membrane protein YphA (DoxX/SURF4 family)